MEGDSSMTSLASSPLSSVPSSPLSSLAASPSPPPEYALPDCIYPSPPTSQASRQTSSDNTPTPDGMDSNASTDKEGPPPAKRRRISRPRTTEYLDLRAGDVDPEQQPELDRLLHVLHNRQKIVVIAGAGISVSAGISDFRSSTGLFRTLKHEHKLKGSGKDLFDASVYKDDSSTASFHSMVSTMSRQTRDARPTAFHHMLATIAKEDRLLRLYSQNVDELDTSLEPLRTNVPLRKNEDGKWPRTVQLHGGLGNMVCSKCHELSSLEADLFSGPTAPTCARCEEINEIRTTHEGKRSHGIGRLRPRMVLYNEHNPDDVAIGAVTREDLRKRPDAVIVAGTTLKVPGVQRIVREMCGVVRDRRGGVAIWINNDLPPVVKALEDCFDIIVQGPCDQVASLAAMRQWDEPAEVDSYSEITDAEAKRVEAMQVEVCVSQDELLHTRVAALPSLQHLNNTFPPPSEGFSTPRKELPSPIDLVSPLTSRRPTIMPSIEPDGDNIDVSDGTGLLTPSKSQKGSPAKVLPLTIKLSNKLKPPAFNAMDAKPAKKKPGPKPGTKYIRSANTSKSNGAKPKARGKAVPVAAAATLQNSFVFSKSKKADGQKEAKVPLTPSKLRQVSTAPGEPMVPVSPKDPRNNTSPSKHASPPKKPFFPGLASSENRGAEGKKELFA